MRINTANDAGMPGRFHDAGPAFGLEGEHRSLLESMEQGFCVLEMLFDHDGKPVDYRFLDMNRAFSQHTGLNDAIGKTARELVPTLDTYWFDTYGRVALTGEPIRFENEAPAMHRWFDVYASRFGDSESRKVALFFNDITARKRVEAEREQLLKELTVANNRMADVFRQAPAVMCVLRGPEHIFEMTNDRYRQLVGKRDLIGQAARKALPEVEGQGFFELLDQVYRTGETIIRSDMRLLLQRHAGRPAEARYFDFAYMPLRDGYGNVTGVVAQGVDLTDRKIAEERLKLLDAVGMATRDAIDARAVMVTTTRLLGEHLQVTRCAYADLEPDNDSFTIRHNWTAEGAATTVGTYSLDLFGPRAAADMRHGRTLIIRDVDRELSPSDGAGMFNAIGVKAIICYPLVKDDSLVAMMAVHQNLPRDWSTEDVALVQEVAERSWAHVERVRSTEALREADQRKTEFLATLAHELRNPLAPIQTGLDILRIAVTDPSTLEKIRAMMERQLKHLVHLVDDLLDVARITRGKVELRKERIELKSVVTSAIEASSPLIEACGHAFSVRLPDEPIQLDVDPTRIAQVVGNLLNNAAKYTPAGGGIVLTAQRDQDDVTISVKDTGVGIPRDRLHDVFEMFSQVGRSTGHAQGGLGIGLTLVRRLVELHGGTATASSAGPGRGSEFTVRLPLYIDSPHRSPSSGAALDRSGDSAKLRVLVIDDNKDAAETLSALLSIDGHATRVANDGHHALRLALEFQPEMVFLDIGMPGMDGYEVIAELRKMDAMKHAVIVAVTGWGAERDRRQAQEAGFDHHLTKPASYADVQRLIRQVALSG